MKGTISKKEKEGKGREIFFSSLRCVVFRLRSGKIFSCAKGQKPQKHKIFNGNEPVHARTAHAPGAATLGPCYGSRGVR